MMVSSITVAAGTLIGVAMANVMANAVVTMRGILNVFESFLLEAAKFFFQHL